MKDNQWNTTEIEVPEIVESKVNQTLAQIRQEEFQMAKEKRKKQHTWKRQAAVLACISVAAAGSITAVAAASHLWSRGMQGNIQATEEQQWELMEQGMAETYDEESSYEGQGVTVGGVTVKPTGIVADERMVYLSFSVEGLTIPEDAEPGFDSVNLSLEESGEQEDNWLNMSGSFYNGIVSDAEGNPIYDNGEPIQFYENGNLIEHYADADGNFEYIMTAYPGDGEQSLLGQTLHVTFENLGTLYKTQFAGVVEGVWNFVLTIPEKSSAKHIEVNLPVEGTVFTVESVELSPVSIQLNYRVEGTVAADGDSNGIPEFQGVVLRDGTRLSYLGDGGMSDFTDAEQRGAYMRSGFERVIEPDQVKTLLLQIMGAPQIYTVELP